MKSIQTEKQIQKKRNYGYRIKSVQNKVERITDSIFSNIKIQFEKKPVCAVWYNGKNWGDALNPILIKHLSGKTPIHVTEYTLNLKNFPIYSVIGSMLDMPILQNKRILKNTVIWGTGFIQESGKIHETPREICAVRGPLTREIIKKQGMKCPEVYGDPALFYSKIYKPIQNKKNKLGIIPHYIDKSHDFIKKFSSDPDIKIIDIEGPINHVVDEICSCKYIASSSLHGIIIADAYNIPSVWITISDRVIGNGFKFRDYFSSVGQSEKKPMVISEKTTVDTIYNEFTNDKIDIDLKELLDACPFYNGAL